MAWKRIKCVEYIWRIGFPFHESIKLSSKVGIQCLLCRGEEIKNNETGGKWSVVLEMWHFCLRFVLQGKQLSEPKTFLLRILPLLEQRGWVGGFGLMEENGSESSCNSPLRGHYCFHCSPFYNLSTPIIQTFQTVIFVVVRMWKYVLFGQELVNRGKCANTAFGSQCEHPRPS